MLKSVFRGLGVTLSFLSMGTMATAGSLADGVADPQVEDLVVEDDDRGLGIWPIVGLVVVGAIILSTQDDDDDDTPIAKPD